MSICPHRWARAQSCRSWLHWCYSINPTSHWGAKFDIKNTKKTLLSMKGLFGGMDWEDLNQHLLNFIVIWRIGCFESDKSPSDWGYLHSHYPGRKSMAKWIIKRPHYYLVRVDCSFLGEVLPTVSNDIVEGWTQQFQTVINWSFA